MNLDLLRLLRIRLKDFRGDIILLIVIGFLLMLVFQFYFPLNSYIKNWIKKDYDLFPGTLEVIKFATWFITFFIVKWMLSLAYSQYFKKRNQKFSFNYPSYNTQALTENRITKEFIFQGNIKLYKKGLEIANTNAGCLIKPHFGFLKYGRVWYNFTAHIELEFLKQNENFLPLLGIIFRAQNFDNYIMIELVKNNSNLIIRPHIRIEGNWDAPIQNTDSNILRNIFRTRQRTLKIQIQVKDRKVYIKELTTNQSLVWIIATHAEPNNGNREINHIGGIFTGEIPFLNHPGKFGFRNYGNEYALIKSLDIES